jgi:hypothetical protein
LQIHKKNNPIDMATSTNKAKSFFEQRKNATKTATIVDAAAETGRKIETIPPKPQGLEPLLNSENNDIIATKMMTQKKALGEKRSVPLDLKNFIETTKITNKINVNIPIEIDNKLQVTLLQLKSKYSLNNRQINKTILLSYIISKALREDETLLSAQ